MFLEFFVWWYGKGWLEAGKVARGWVNKVQMGFSASILLRTLFSPWRQIITPPGRGLDEKFKALVDNLVSRFIGFLIRLTILIAAFVMIIFSAVGGVLLVILWPFIPITVVYFIFRSITG